ncbi:MAG: hypothetical protein Q8R28_04765, partial [Dehalococcoidia bacterium]|nr:hypothetical protein [Dehalococcoidia bacterium]
PVEVRMLTDSPHQRTTILRYNAAWSDGGPIVTAEARSLELVFEAASGASAASVLSWELPIPYGPGYSGREVSIAGAARTHTGAAAYYPGHTHGSASGDRGQGSRPALSDFFSLRAAPLTLTSMPHSWAPCSGSCGSPGNA